MKNTSKLNKRIIAFVLMVSIVMSCMLIPAGVAEEDDKEKQRNAIAMLNYITVLTQEINASKNNRLYMEQAYNELLNNTYGNSVKSRTLNQLNGLMDTMESYRMVAVKRERLQYIYNQNQAQAIRAAVPNPLGLMSAVQSFRPSKIVSAIAYMAVDSITSYNAYTAEADLQYLKDGWELDDKEAEVLHNSRKDTFNYMINMVNENNIPGEYALTENSVEEFVKWKNNDNVISRIQFLESNQETYRYYGGYWLTLCESYYENGDYAKCLEAMDQYESIDARIFLKDYEMARTLLFAISAADEVLNGKAYINMVSHYAQLILDNTKNSDWALRYFAAQSFVDLYAKTNDKSYLQTAYKVCLNNVNNELIAEQRKMNEDYLAPVTEAEMPEKLTKDEEKQIKPQIKDYNKMLKENRKTELPPVSEPLLLNCELLFALAEELDISEKEQSRVDGILHPKGEPAFLVQPLDAKYWFSNAPQLMSAEETEIEYGGTAIILPAVCVTDQASITVMVKDKDAAEAVTMTDWKIDKVERVSKDDVSTFKAVYTSADAKKYDWKPEAEIAIDVVPREGFNFECYHFEYMTHGTKDKWLKGNADEFKTKVDDRNDL